MQPAQPAIQDDMQKRALIQMLSGAVNQRAPQNMMGGISQGINSMLPMMFAKQQQIGAPKPMPPAPDPMAQFNIPS